MTRINGTISPKVLSDQHLLGEYKEILRVNGLAVKFSNRGGGKLPERFTLGSGHVKFFFNKLGFIGKRFKLLCDEMVSRGYRVNIVYNDPCLYGYMGDWGGCVDGNKMVKGRIIERSIKMKKLTYYGESISVNEYREMLDI